MRPLASLALLLALAAPAQAQSPPPACGPREQVITALTGEKYGEQPMVELEGTPTGSVMHLYGNPITGTWTFVSFPNPAIACIFGTGKKMRMLHPLTQGKPA